MKTIVSLLCILTAMLTIRADGTPAVSVDPLLYKISVLGKDLTAKRFIRPSDNSTAGYLACIGDLIGPSQLDASPISLGVGICPSAPGPITLTHWPLPSGFSGDNETEKQKRARNAVRQYLSDCGSNCPDLWSSQ